MSKDYYEEHKNDYFDYKGVRYYAGTKFKKRAYGDTTVDAVFTRRFGREFWFRYKFPGRSDVKIDRCSEKDFYDNLVEIINDSDISEFERKKHYLKESEVPEIVCGWIIYILVNQIAFSPSFSSLCSLENAVFLSMTVTFLGSTLTHSLKSV